MRQAIRLAVRGFYDLQQLRIQTGNRLVNHYLNKMGIEPGQKKNSTVTLITKQLEQEYKLVTDGLAAEGKKYTFKPDGLISDFAEYSLVNLYFRLRLEEKQAEKYIAMQVEQHPLWQAFLKDVKGVGYLMAGVIISEFNITKAKYVSNLWAYAGLDVALDGRGRGKYSEHLIEVEYKAKDGTVKKKKSITFNPFLKAKLLGVLAGSFLKSKSPYAQIYYDYKHRLENHPKHKDDTLGHRNNMAKRYMIKMFLKDLYPVWRGLEGLDVYPPYEEAKLGIKHTA